MSGPRRTARPRRRRPAASTRTASRRPAGCCSRSTARRRSTGSPPSPPGWSAPATPRSRCSPTRTPVVGGFGLPAGRHRRPRAADRRAVGDRRPHGDARSTSPSAAADERVAEPARRHVRPGPGLPRFAARSRRPATSVGALAVYDPEPRTVDRRRGRAAAAARRVRRRRAGALRRRARPSAPRSPGSNVALEASSIGIWETRPPDAAPCDWDERCAALFGARRRPPSVASDAGARRFRAPRRPRPRAGRPWTAPSRQRGQFTAEFRALRPDGSRALDGRPRPGGRPTRAASRYGSSGTILDVTDARQQAEQRLAAMQRATAIAEVAAELANAARHGGPRRDRAARRAGARRPVQRAGHLRRRRRAAAAAHDPAADRRGPGPRRLPRRRASRSSCDDSQPTQYAAMHGGARPAGRSRRSARPLPGRPGGHRDPRRPRDRRPAAAGGGAGPRLVRRASGDRPRVRRRRRRGARGAGRADRAQRLAAPGRRRARRAVAAMAEANQRLQLLAEAGRVLSGTLEIDAAGRCSWPSSSSPSWATGAGSSSPTSRAGCTSWPCAHRDPSRREEVDGLRAADGRASMTDEAAARVVTATGRPMIVPSIDCEPRGAGASRPRRSGRRWPGWASASGTVVPLVARGQTLGALGLFNREERGPLSPAEVDTAVEIGRRAGLALHHARLFGQQRDARRRAAAQHAHRAAASPTTRRSSSATCRPPPGAEIGGDWYDAFLQADGATGARDRRRRRPRHPRRRGDGPGARPAARHRVLQRGLAGRGAHRAGPRDRGARARHHGDGAGRPPRAGRGRPAGRADPAALVQRRAPAARAARRRRQGRRCSTTTAPTCCSA